MIVAPCAVYSRFQALRNIPTHTHKFPTTKHDERVRKSTNSGDDEGFAALRTKASVEFEDNLPGMHDFSRWTWQYTIYRGIVEIHGKSWSMNPLIRQADCEKEGKSWTIEQARLDGMRKLVTEYVEWKRVSCSV
jgi:hypothetical protein